MPSSTKLKTKHNKSLLISSSVFSLLLVTTLVSGLVLSGTRTHADDTTQSDNVTVTVSSACTLSRSAGSGTYSATLNPGQETGDISGSTIKAICNDGNGYSLYAIGYSGDSYTGNNTKMIGTYGNIDTGTSGSDSWWAMKLAPVAGDHAPTIVNSFDNYHVVPATFTQVAKLTSATDTGESANGSSVDVFYKVKASTSQVAGTYTGKVKYTLVHPNAAPTPTTNLYQTIANMSKGKQSLSDIQAEITTANSGVYEYDPSVFGAASDAASTSTIYYYRGILDNTVGTYGSDGDGELYPNYVKLDNDTCWRIVRTTGSGGVKMIYNGIWDATNSTCANAETAAQLTTKAFNGASSTSRNIAYVGYTYDNDMIGSDKTIALSVDTVFGSNSDVTVNDTSSTIKNYIETEWYANANGLGSYTSILEPSAGYCNDRSAYTDDTTATAMTEIPPYATANASMYFGAYGRNANATNAEKTPSLTCPRGTVDLYTTNNASDGNKQLANPVALLTADEASLAGSGRTDTTQGSAMNDHSFLRSGSYFWLLSPCYRYTNGLALEFYLGATGGVSYGNVNGPRGVRPVISLASGTSYVSGSGTAADPWVVNAPTN